MLTLLGYWKKVLISVLFGVAKIDFSRLNNLNTENTSVKRDVFLSSII